MLGEPAARHLGSFWEIHQFWPPTSKFRCGCHGVTRYQPDCEKIIRLHAQTAMIENGPVVLEPLVASAESLNAQLWPNNFHKNVQNRLALLGKESVSVGHRRHPLSGKSGDPTHAYLYHWQ